MCMTRLYTSMYNVCTFYRHFMYISCTFYIHFRYILYTFMYMVCKLYVHGIDTFLSCNYAYFLYDRESAVLFKLLPGRETVAVDVDAIVALMGIVYCGQDGYLVRRDSCIYPRR